MYMYIYIYIYMYGIHASMHPCMFARTCRVHVYVIARMSHVHGQIYAYGYVRKLSTLDVNMRVLGDASGFWETSR